MNTETPKRGVGRPATGREYTLPVKGYENSEGKALIQAIMEKRGVNSEAALLRLLVREEAQRLEDREAVGRRLREAAADPRIQEYYRNLSEEEG